MLVMGFDGCEIHDLSPVAQWLANDGLGGVLLFDKDLVNNLYGKNLKNKNQIKKLVQKLHNYSGETALQEKNIPLLVALDYEGGAVDRLAKVDGCMTTMPAKDLANLSITEFDQEVSQMAVTLKSLGFNLNFAPVVDLNLNKEQGIIGTLGRSFSEDPELVSRSAKQFVEIFNKYGVACCYKHFPGHGSAAGDTHEGFVDSTGTFDENELIPYTVLLKDMSNPVMVMTAHVVNKHLDSQGLPATLSYEILTGLLREKIGYDGVIISDDMQMHAIANHFSLAESLELTINAGADMIIFGNQLGTITAPQIIDCIEHLVTHNKIEVNRIDEAYRRVIRLKQHMMIESPIDI
jgi:beta-N-acetylhexosaminidase